MFENLFSLKGKVALVNGASKEMGSAVAYALAEYGADVAVTARSADQLAAVAARIQSMGRKGLAIPMDLTRFSEFPALMDRVVNELGGLDIMVNVHGGGEGDFKNFGPFMRTTEDKWDYMVNINLKSQAFLCLAAANVMKNRGGGRIINVSSASVNGPSIFESIYGAAKAGLEHLSRTLSVEWARYGIRVNVVTPGLINTANGTNLAFATPQAEAALRNSMPLGRIGEGSDIAAAVLFFASPASEWVTGTRIVVDGGAPDSRGIFETHHKGPIVGARKPKP
jgi:NAD(P)-dependent dehydrogenase (short-subunit alcohol dehydrogenase family)